VNAVNEQRPAGLSDEALSAWAHFLLFHAAVTDRLGRELVERAGMPLTWYDVLLQLDAAPDGRLRMQDLASAVVLSKSGLTRLVDRLQRAGYVDRTSCPSDRRGTFAEITASGRDALEQARPVHLRGVAEHFAAHLTDDDVAALDRIMAALLAAEGAPAMHAACGAEIRRPVRA
jgi:DNA-binding MarR family transcriptional regulator